MLRNALLLAGAISLAMPTTVIAQDAGSGRPDEGTSWKYFYFHKPGVSVEKARGDIIECYTFARGLTVAKAGSNPTYTSVPYSGSNYLSPAASALAAGVGALAGALIAGLMDAGDRRAMERTNLRKCFGFKGYNRYELEKADYKLLNDGELEEIRARLIEKATGPTPADEKLVP